METPVLIPIDQIDPNPYQPRQAEDPAVVAEIADSIARNGLMQPPTARRVNGRVQLAFGHTRLAAFHVLQEECMPLFLRELDDLQMFELGVAENIKRRDLNPIEQAEAMKRYMQEFNKTSAEAGQFFNVSEEQVRGTVRLINLVPEAQQALREGKINITTARSLLSMQKVAPPDVIAKTIQHLEKGEDRWGNQEIPEKIVETAVESLDEVVDMWNDTREGKPRSSWKNGWLLSMKNFPNKLLSYLTPVDLAVALGIQDDQRMIAGANTFKMWKTGELNDPPYTQEEIDAMELPAEIIAKIEHLLNPPDCSACPFYTRINGSHFCGMKTCHTRKTEAWKEHVIQAAVKDLGIPLYTEKDGKREVLRYEHEKLFTARNKDLRLIPRDQVRGYHWQNFKGVEDQVFVVVMVGETLQNKTQAIKEARSQEKSQQSADHKKSELLLAARIRLYWESTIYLAELFAALPLDALETLTEVGYSFDVDLPEDVEEPGKDQQNEYRAQFLRRQVAMAMLNEKDTFNLRSSWKTAAAVADWLKETSQAWGIKLPRAFFKVAEQLDEELASVTAETVKKNKKGRAKP